MCEGKGPTRQEQMDSGINIEEWCRKYDISRGKEKNMIGIYNMQNIYTPPSETKHIGVDTMDLDAANKSGKEIYQILRNSRKNQQYGILGRLRQSELTSLSQLLLDIIYDLKIRIIQKSMLGAYFQKTVKTMRGATKKIISLMFTLNQVNYIYIYIYWSEVSTFERIVELNKF